MRIWLAVALVTPAAASPVGAADVDGWLDLPEGMIDVVLDDADLSIVLSPAVATARIRAVPDAAGAATAPTVESSGDTVSILPPAEPPPSRLRLEIEAPIGRTVHLRGARLRASLLATGGDDAVGFKSDQPPPSPVDIDVVDSTITVEGPVVLGVTAAGSQVTATSVGGAVELGLIATVATIAGGGGTLTSNIGADSTLEVEDRTGALELHGSDAAIVVNRCTGALAAELAGGRIEIDGHRGLLTVTGDRTAVRAARSEFPRGSLDVSDTTVSFEALRANLTVGLVASTVELHDLWGALQLTVDGSSTVEGDEIQGSVGADLRPGAGGRFSFRKGVLEAKLDDAELEVGGAQYLTIDAQRSTVVAKGFTGIKELRSFDSEIELDGTSARRVDNVSVRGRSTLRLTVGSPCRVKVLGIDATDASGLSVFGCETGYGKRPRWTGPWADSLGHHPTSVVLEIGHGAEVTVEGRL